VFAPFGHWILTESLRILSSVTVTLANVTFPVFFTTNEYVMTSPASTRPLLPTFNTPDFAMVTLGAAVKVTVFEPVAVVMPFVAVPVFVTLPISRFD
jgi:hypothetical protein